MTMEDRINYKRFTGYCSDASRLETWLEVYLYVKMRFYELDVQAEYLSYRTLRHRMYNLWRKLTAITPDYLAREGTFGELRCVRRPIDVPHVYLITAITRELVSWVEANRLEKGDGAGDSSECLEDKSGERRANAMSVIGRMRRLIASGDAIVPEGADSTETEAVETESVCSLT